MSCKEILDAAIAGQSVQGISAPMRVVPSCHPRCHCEVHVDPHKRIIYLSCSKCDRPISRINLGKRKK